MFCKNCGFGLASDAKFCSKCGSGQESNISSQNDGLCASRSSAQSSFQACNEPSTSGLSWTPHSSFKKGNVKSFSAYRKYKGQEWKAIVTKKTTRDKEVNVQIMIGLMELNEKELHIKPKRGKRVALNVSNKAPYHLILQKAVQKWKAFHRDCYDEDEDYVLLFENGEEAQFLPGSSNKEFFSLIRYKEEIGKDFNKIVLYLCTVSDFNFDPKSHSEDGDEDKLHATKRMKTQEGDEPDATALLASDETLASDEKLASDETLARKLQKEEFDCECNEDIKSHDDKKEERSEGLQPNTVHKDTASVLKSIASKVDKDGQFFLVVRRGAPLPRILSLWQRESNKSFPAKMLRVQYCGESGIDTGAMSQEFLAKVIPDMGLAMFPDGAPVNSIYNVHNRTFKTCGEIAAVSLAQGGPAPCFLEESVYYLLLDPGVDINNLTIERHFTAKDRDLFKALRDTDTFDDALTDIILDNGYTGIIDQGHREDIIGTIKVSIITKRLLYLKEFCEGLKLYNVYETTRNSALLCKALFVRGLSQAVDANYVFSQVNPSYSKEGSSRKALEEAVIDNLQDFLMTLEDESICGYSEAIAWREKSSLDEESDTKKELGTDRFESADVTPAGVLGWLTGQKHRPLNGELLTISAHFDHECLVNNPKHTICFPHVGACSREVTFPVAHMTDPKEFRNVFLLALCKGNAFSKA